MSSYFRALAWGTNAPINTADDAGSVLWLHARINGRLNVLAELPFQQATERALAEQIRRMDAKLRIEGGVSLTVATPAIFPPPMTETIVGIRGETISERLSLSGIDCVPGDADQLNGWARVHALLEKGPDGKPLLTFDASCQHLIKSLESAMSAENDPDIIATEAPALTALRLAVMSRPSTMHEPDPYVDPPFGSPAYYMKQLRQGESRSFGRVH